MFREAAETAIVVSVLLSFLNATFSHDRGTRRMMSTRVWIGTALGILSSLAIGAAFLVLIYKYASNIWARAELIWEAAFGLLACTLLTVMAVAFLRYDTLAAKWTAKLSKVIKKAEEDENARAVAAGADKSAVSSSSNTKTADLESGMASSTATLKDGDFIKASDDIVPTTVLHADPVPTTAVRAASPAPVKRNKFWALVMGDRSQAAERERAAPAAEAATNDTTTTASDSSSLVDSDGETLNEGEKKVVGLGAMLFIPFITVLREGLEGIVFLAGIAVSEDPGTIPLAVIFGLMCGMAIGFILYRFGNSIRLHLFFVCASILLLIIAGGLLSKAAMAIETHLWAVAVNALEDPDALDSYDVGKALWHLDCCKASTPGGWSLLNALVGWDAHATVSSVTVYCMYWLALAAGLVALKLHRRRTARAARALKANTKAAAVEEIEASKAVAAGESKAVAFVEADVKAQ
ncbi:hypothetical protein HDU96_001545 [Phlyctochytrium bullatum]|nr:hypothetical protein HDU96_001545 [Phlyctochytrium bullatum]